MPIRRTSIDSNQDTGFYTPEVYSNVGSRVVGLLELTQYYEWQAFPYTDFDSVWVDWTPS